MKKKVVIAVIVAAVLLTPVAFAKTVLVGTTVNPSGKTVNIPERALEVAPHVFSLGTAIDPVTNLEVEGYMIVKKKEAPGKPGTVCGNGICEIGENAKKCSADCGEGDPVPVPDDSSGCYEFLAKDTKWKSVEPWVVNAANTSGLSEGFVLENMISNISDWEEAADGYDILGEGSLTLDELIADSESPDGINEVYFAGIEDSGTIAVTIIWGVFGGNPHDRVLVEWDQVYDDVDFVWSETGEPDKMDFWNIAIHELGHSMGMADLYTDECSQETMYGYASDGDINKRDLNSGDIAGIRKLY